MERMRCLLSRPGDGQDDEGHPHGSCASCEPEPLSQSNSQEAVGTAVGPSAATGRVRQASPTIVAYLPECGDNPAKAATVT
jgi:hypothetical protein